MNVSGPFSVGVVYYDDANRGLVYVLAHCTGINPMSKSDCDAFIARIWRATDGYSTTCMRANKTLEGRYGAPLFVLMLRDMNDQGSSPYFISPERRRALDVMLEPKYRRRLGLNAEVVRDRKVHIGTVLNLEVLAGDAISPDEYQTLRNVRDPEVKELIRTSRGVTVLLKRPALPQNECYGGGEKYVYEVGERLARKLAGFTTDQPETVVIGDPDPVASLFEQYRYAGPSST